MQYIKVIQWEEDLSLKTTKLHQMLHLIFYVERFGEPEKFNLAWCESNHINRARTAQKRAEVLVEQTAKRH